MRLLEAVFKHFQVTLLDFQDTSTDFQDTPLDFITLSLNFKQSNLKSDNSKHFYLFNLLCHWILTCDEMGFTLACFLGFVDVILSRSSLLLFEPSWSAGEGGGCVPSELNIISISAMSEGPRSRCGLFPVSSSLISWYSWFWSGAGGNGTWSESRSGAASKSLWGRYGVTTWVGTDPYYWKKRFLFIVWGVLIIFCSNNNNNAFLPYWEILISKT